MEVIVVIVAVAVLAALAASLLSAMAKASKPRGRSICVSNLMQVGLASRMWAQEHGDKFPWAVSTNEGGTLEFASTPDVFRHFLALTNELSSPKVLRCDKDSMRVKALAWDQLTNNAHLSYFAGLDADESRPQTILSGDRNLTTNRQPASGVIAITTNTVLGFTRAMHATHGNIGLSDGSAQQVAGASLQRQTVAQVQGGTVQPLRLAIP